MYRVLLSVTLLISTGMAADLKVRVVDPQNAAVVHAHVAVYADGQSRAVAIKNTSGEGLAGFGGLRSGAYRLEVLAAGFATQRVTVMLPQEEEVRVQLRVAAPGETLEVSATRTPLPAEESAADVSSLSAVQLNTLLPATAADALRFLPGAVVNDAGRRGGLASLFVRGGESRYNKVLIDGVPVNDPGGTFNFGVVSLPQVDRLEFVRSAESTLYGSDAMTSVVQFWTRNGATRTPELTLGADGGTFATAHGYAALAGARGRWDYNVFADQFNTDGQGTNDAYGNASQGANLGVVLSSRAFFRLRARHANSRSGVQSLWNFNGQPLLPPETDERTRQNDFLSSAELTVSGPARWQHRFAGFEYHHRRHDVNAFNDLGRVSPLYGPLDLPFAARADINRAGFDYQGEYWARSWARTTFGYHFEDENGWVGDLLNPPLTHGLRRNHGVFGEQIVTWRRLSWVGGLRFEHNETFGDKLVPRVAASLLALRGGELFSGTRLRFAYGEGIMAPRFEESFASGPFIIPNPHLNAEQTRALEAGVQQNLDGKKLLFGATYFHNLFTNQIAFSMDPTTFMGQYVNVNRALAHGAEVQFRAAPRSHLTVDAAYTYTSTQILAAPYAFDPLLAAGRPLLRRPKHSATVLVSWLGSKWGAEVAGAFVGRRADSDFLGLLPPVTYAAGYGCVDFGGWRAINSRVTAYLKVGNLLNRHYEEAAGYPALRAHFRAGLKFRIGGE